MIVIAVILVLFSIWVVPYNIYMDRSRVEQTVDAIAQKWTLAHTDVRNGILYDADKNANMLLDFEVWSSEIWVFLLSGSTVEKPPISGTSNKNIKRYSRVVFPKNIKILSFSSETIPEKKNLGYLIEAPYGSGAFFTDKDLFYTGGIKLVVWYPDGTTKNLRAREIFLAPQYYR